MKLWPLGLYRVAGDSMRPTYRPGDLLLGWRWFRPKRGDIVVIQRDRLIIKRVSHVNAEGVFVEGDNPLRSTDSRSFGRVPPSQVKAKILLKLG